MTDFASLAPHSLVDALRVLTREPLWYRDFDQARYAAKYLGDPCENDEPSQSSIETIAGAFEILLGDDAVALGSAGNGLYDWDSERLPLDTIVIHHSAYTDGINLSALSALELVRIYAPTYKAPAPDDTPRVDGRPIYTGHVDARGRQVFYPYHWMIRQNGEAIRLLGDEQIGWHAGAWSVNRSSVAICFDDDLSDTVPNDLMLASAAKIIRPYRDVMEVSVRTIVGHGDVFKGTECPGGQFEAGRAWKNHLIGLVDE